MLMRILIKKIITGEGRFYDVDQEHTETQVQKQGTSKVVKRRRINSITRDTGNPKHGKFCPNKTV